MQLAAQGTNLPFCFNRKEAKDHGEGGTLVGAPPKGKVLVLDDVISAGTSVRESVEIIRASGAELAGVVIALDRMERGSGEKSAVQEVRDTFGVPVIAVATLEDLMRFIADSPELAGRLEAVQQYRDIYGTRLSCRLKEWSDFDPDTFADRCGIDARQPAGIGRDTLPIVVPTATAIAPVATRCRRFATSAPIAKCRPVAASCARSRRR